MRLFGTPGGSLDRARATYGFLPPFDLALATPSPTTFEAGNLLVWRSADPGTTFDSTDLGVSFHFADPGRVFRESSL